MALQPTLYGPTNTSVEVNYPLDFVLVVSASANETFTTAQVRVSAGDDKGACAYAASPISLGNPFNNNILNTSTTGSYAFSVVLFGPTTGAFGAAGSQQVLGSGVFGVSVMTFNATGSPVASNTVYVTASSVK